MVASLAHLLRPSARIHRINQLESSLAAQVADTAPQTQSPSMREVLPSIYEELCRIGRAMLRCERDGHNLQPPEVVNEAFLRLASIDPKFNNREHCFRLLAQAMRRVLIDHARAKTRSKRELPCPDELERLQTMPYEVGQTPIDILDVDRALTALAKQNAAAAEMIQLHWYFGVEAVELGPLFKVSEASVNRTLRFARAWLNAFCQKQLGKPVVAPSPEEATAEAA